MQSFVLCVCSFPVFLLLLGFNHRRHPNIVLRRIFVFNYTFDDPMTGLTSLPLHANVKDPQSLVIFPPEGPCGGDGPSASFPPSSSSTAAAAAAADTLFASSHRRHDSTDSSSLAGGGMGVSMVDVHLNEVMSHAALRIILALEQQMRVCDEARARNVLPESLPLSTSFDDIEEQQMQLAAASSGKRQQGPASLPFRKKPAGRIRKWQGDLSMQVCSPRDAVEHFQAAIVECRALGETMWLAGALEGYASAVLLLLQMQYNVEDILGKELRIGGGGITSSGLIGGGGGGTGTSSSASAAAVASGMTLSGDAYLLSESTIERAFCLVEERTVDAVSIYATNIMYCAMEVGCLMRLARLHETSPIELNRETKVRF
jgi:hypothetical protein